MEILLYNTPSGLKPCYDEDYEEKKKLKIGEIYKAKITIPRNIKHHRKFFAMLKTCWEYQSEERRAKMFQNSFDLFRQTVLLAAGISNRIWDVNGKKFIDIPKSISFSNMTQTEFDEVYNRCFDVLCSIFVSHVSRYELEANFYNFL